MNEKLNQQLSQLSSALGRTEEALLCEPTPMNKDATIQRFEFTLELTWKTIKSYSESQNMVPTSPRDCFRLAAQLNLINDPQIWFDFLDARNSASHTYNQKLADSVYAKIPSFIEELKRLISKLQSD